MEIYLYIMENLLADFHGIERFPYTMEIFFISCLRKNAPAVLLKYLKDRTAPCYCFEQFYHQICHFLLLAENKSSSTPSPFSLHYCSDAPVRAVVIKNSSISTAPCYCFEQFYQQICRFLLLLITVSSSSIGKFATFYCSDSPVRAVVIKHSPVSTAPYYCLEQFYKQICHFLLLRRLSSSSSDYAFSCFYCSLLLFRAVL